MFGILPLIMWQIVVDLPVIAGNLDSLIQRENWTKISSWLVAVHHANQG
jgi:hypothetical protein